MEESLTAIGIDPSWVSGSLVIGTIDPNQTTLLQYGPMPDAEGLISVLTDWLPRCQYVFLEAIPKFAGENRSASHMSVLQTNYGFLQGAIRMHAGPKLVEFVPAKWMNLIGYKVRSRDRAIRKKGLQKICQEMFPERRWSLEASDSPLILEAGRLSLFPKKGVDDLL